MNKFLTSFIFQSDASDNNSNASADSGVSQVSVEHPEWSYSLFTDILLTLHLTTAAVYLVYSVKKFLAEVCLPTVASIESYAEIFTESSKLIVASSPLLMRPEVIISLIVIFLTVLIGKEIGDFRVLRMFWGHLIFLLSRFVIYIFIFSHYYYIRIFVENV